MLAALVFLWYTNRERWLKMNILYFGFDMFAPCLEYLLSLENVNIMKVYSFESDGYFYFHDKVKALARKNDIEFTLDKITAQELKKQKAIFKKTKRIIYLYSFTEFIKLSIFAKSSFRSSSDFSVSPS